MTRSVDGDVFTLDGRPALTAYLKRLGAPAEAHTDPVAFDGFSRFHPLGIRRGAGEEPRHVHSTRHLQQGWLHSHGEVPEGELVSLMEGDEESVLRAVDDASRDAVQALSGQPPLGLLAFDCECRGQLLGDAGRRHEVSRLVAQAGGIPVAGLYTWGEIARLRGMDGYHNWMFVALAIG